MNPFILDKDDDDGSSGPCYKTTVKLLERSIRQPPCRCAVCASGFRAWQEQRKALFSYRHRLLDEEAERNVRLALKDIHSRRASLTKLIRTFSDVLLSR